MLTSTPGIIASRKRNTSEYEALVSTGTQFPIRGLDTCTDIVPASTDLEVFDSTYKLGSSYNTGVAQSFVVSNAIFLYSIYVNLRRVGTLTGTTLYARIYYGTGTYGTNATPGNQLGELSTVNAGVILAYNSSYDPDNTFNTSRVLMTNNSSVLLQPGVVYTLAIEYSGGDANNYLEIATRTVNLETNSNFAYKTTGSWTGINTVSMCMMLCGAVHPYDVTTNAYNFNNVTNYRTIGVGGVQKVGISFTTASVQQLVSFTLFLKTVGTAANTTGSFNMELYAAASNQPTGSLLTASDTVNVSSIRSIYDQFTFNFTPYTLAASTTYTLVMIYKGGTVSTDISIGIGQDTTTSGYTGNSFYQNIGSATWTNESSTIDHCFIMGIVNYTEAAFDTYDATLNGDQFNYIAATQNTKMAQSFTGIDGLFSKVSVNLRATGSPTGNITASLFADDGGTFGTTGKPTGTALATSTAIAASTISATETQYTFTFASPYTMTAGTVYWIAIEYSSGSSSNKIGVVVDISSPTAPGRLAYYNGTTWAFTTFDSVGTSGATDDLCYVLYALS